MKRKFQSFSIRLTRKIILVMLFTMTIAFGVVIFFSSIGTYTMMNDHFRDILKMTGERIEGVLKAVEVSSINNADEIADQLSSPEAVQEALKHELRVNTHINGCAVAFIPNYYPQKGYWYEPYATHGEGDNIIVFNIGSQGHDYHNTEWFINGLEKEEGYWSNPYLDSLGAKNVLTTYTLPLKDAQGRIAGVFGADITLEWLTKQVQEMNLYANEFTFSGDDDYTQEAYCFILGRNGDYLVHPDPKRILAKSYFDYVGESKDGPYERLGRDMLDGKSGFHITKIDGVRSFIYFAPVMHNGWSMAIVVPSITVFSPGILLGLIILLMLIIGLLTAFLLTTRTIRSTVRPLKQLAQSAEEVAKGNFDTPLPEIRDHDEIRQLRDSFQNMQESLTDYIQQLTEAATRQAAIDRELDIARGIQMSMLPKVFPPYPERKDIDIFGLLTPAKTVGGDLYDFAIQNNKLYFCIGDVSGKGIPAAILMAVTSYQLRTLSADEDNPARILGALNESLSSRNESLMFVTLFFGVLDLSTGELQYCNAGHDAPILREADGRVRYMDVESNVAVGVMPDWSFQLQKTRIAPGTTLFLFTDGLTEAENSVQELFGMDRTFQAAQEADASSPSAFLSHVSEAVKTYVAGADQSDDLTMLAIQYRG